MLAVTGFMNFCGQIGSFILALTFGKLADLTHNFNTPVLVIASVFFAGCLLWLLIDASRPLMKRVQQELVE